MRSLFLWLEAARASPVNSYLIFVVFLVSLTCFLSPECYTILEIYGKNPTRHRLTCACTCLLTDSTAAVVAAAASAAAAAGCAAASTVLLLLACCAGAGAGAGAGAAAPAAAHRHRHQHRRDRRRHRQGQGVSKPAGAGPARSQQEEGLGESRVAHVPSDAGSAPRSVACFGPAPSSEALCYSMKSSHPPPQPHASAAPAWPSVDGAGRASAHGCGERMPCPPGPRACLSAGSAPFSGAP